MIKFACKLCFCHFNIMRPLPFSVRQLQVFAVLCEQLSFRECSERLGISQASVSSQIALLERQLGFKLFSRTSGRKPSITPRGLAFLADLKTFDDAGRALAAHRVVPAAQCPASHFRIHIGEILFNQFIRPRLGRFLSEHPTIECEFDARPPSRELSADREKHGFDFALFHHRADQPWFDGARPLALVRGGIYGVTGFASPAASLTAEQVSALPFIMPKAGSTAERDHLASLSAAGIIPRNIICHSEYFDVMAAMVERGLGVACLTDRKSTRLNSSH